ncbi:hypothetical protein [Bradyrhizobium arachidis]|uniref:hypothetical protein n=1 Tax=Bradyrhizobium arachidis TaxID=858423 RepID=UPI002161B075|nr:hypothetical protein [Bradyrhizobium arachidis]UVO30383.1 hypothetical protein KUF59_06550 [Bradyrhizobium arachidis]
MAQRHWFARSTRWGTTVIDRKIAAYLLNLFPADQTSGELAQRLTSLNLPMTPLQIINDWFETQDAEVQAEIAGMAAFLIFDGADVLDRSNRERVEFVRQWLSESGLQTNTIVGRALTFRACFEYFKDSRFTESGWKRSEKLFCEDFGDAARDPNSDAAPASNAQKVLDDLAARKSKWIEVGKSWRELADACLTSSALRDWTTLAGEPATTAKRAT